jgi:hypothetical protein
MLLVRSLSVLEDIGEKCNRPAMPPHLGAQLNSGEALLARQVGPIR